MYRNNIGDLHDFIGETVTIFTTSGGMSGSGFTGVVLHACDDFVRLVTRIGPPPGCALGNACGKNFRWGDSGGFGGFGGGRNSCCGGYDGGYNYGVGSVVDIPICKIAAVVRNAV